MKKVADLFKKTVSAKEPEKRQQLFEQIKHELKLHAESEEKTFYQAIKRGNAKAERKKKSMRKHEHDENRLRI